MRRPRIRISLRMLLLLATTVAIGLGYLARQRLWGQQQAQAVEQIESLGGQCFRVYAGYPRTTPDYVVERHPVLARLLGIDYFLAVAIIGVGDAEVTQADVRAMAPAINRLRIPPDINNGMPVIAIDCEGNPKIDADFVREMRRVLPRCVFFSSEINTSGLSRQLYGDRWADAVAAAENGG